MAVFIKKDRLGSGPPPRPDSFRLRKSEFKGKGVKFGVMADAFKRASAEAAERREEKYESNAEVQRHRTLTAEEKARDAIDRMIPTAKAVQEMRTGREVTDEEARKSIENLAYKAERIKDGE